MCQTFLLPCLFFVFLLRCIALTPRMLHEELHTIMYRNLTPMRILAKEGEKFHMGIEIDNPENLNISSRWLKETTRLPTRHRETEFVNKDNKFSFQVTSVFLNGTSTETLIITKPEVTDSGTYIVLIQLQDYTRKLEFEVIVIGIKSTPRIEIVSPNQFSSLNHSVYATKEYYDVYCLIESLPPANVTLQYRSILYESDPGSWFDVLPEFLINITGTYENGYQWKTSFNSIIELKCLLLVGNNEANSMIREVLVDQNVPITQLTVKKSEKWAFGEKANFIYEGDDVTLTCKVPDLDTTWSAPNITWMHNGNVLSSLENTKSRNRAPRKYTLVAKIEFHNRDSYKDGDLSSDNSTLTILKVTSEDSGDFVCEATNRAGTEQFKYEIQVNGAPETITDFYLLSFLGLLIVVLTCFIGSFLMYVRQRNQTKKKEKDLMKLKEHFRKSADVKSIIPRDPTIPINYLTDQLCYKKEYEIDASNLRLGGPLGSGQFGEVWKGWLKKPGGEEIPITEQEYIPVAIKVPGSGSDVTNLKMLASELDILCAVGKHPNILSLVGAVTKNVTSGELLMVTEFCENGSLHDYLSKFSQDNGNFTDELMMILEWRQSTEDERAGLLRGESHSTSAIVLDETNQAANDDNSIASSPVEDDLANSDDDSSLATSDLLSFALQVASGMEYLASIPCIHRDLAARNVLVTKRRICKVADFGMSRKKEYYKFNINKDQPMPIRWMAMETIERGSNWQKTDVWSFGILLYEIFTLGGLPYPSISNTHILDELGLGFRNTQPRYCPDEIYDLMQKCWYKEPNLRPTFAECVIELRNYLNLTAPQVSERLDQEIDQEIKTQNARLEWVRNG